MSRACVILLLAIPVVCANATVEFFFTSSAAGFGLADPTKAMLATGTNHTDYLDGWSLSHAGAPPLGPIADVKLVPGGTTWAYIWGRFNNEPQNALIHGIAIGVNNAGVGEGQIAWYKLDNDRDYVTPGAPMMRWDGYAEIFYYNPAGLVAVTAAGVRNLSVDRPVNMYVGGDYRTFLLGAVKVPTWAQPGDEFRFTFGSQPV